MKKIILLVLAAGFFAAGCGRKLDGGPIGPSSSSTSILTQQVGASGGTFSTGVAGVSIPAGALSANIDISILPVAEGSLPVAVPVDTAFVSAATFGPEGQTFSVPVTLTFALKETATAGSILPFYLYNKTTGVWDPSGSAMVSTDGKSATVSVIHFSTYAVMKSTSVNPVYTTVLHNHFYNSGSTESGYFDFSAGIEVGMSTLASGDFVFKSNSSSDATLGSADDASGGIQLLSATNINNVTSVPSTGYVQEIMETSDSQNLKNNCYAVKTMEGTYVALQITEVPVANPPLTITFKWKNIR